MFIVSEICLNNSAGGKCVFFFYLLFAMDLLFWYYQKSFFKFGSTAPSRSSCTLRLFRFTRHQFFMLRLSLRLTELYRGSPFYFASTVLLFLTLLPFPLTNPGSPWQGWRDWPCRTPRPCCTYPHFTHRTPAKRWHWCALTHFHSAVRSWWKSLQI